MKKMRFYFQKRSDFNSWGLPGGAMEFGESAEEACAREFLAETGLKVKVKSLLGVSTNFIQHYPNGDVAQAVVIEFIVELIEKTDENFISRYYNRNYPFIE